MESAQLLILLIKNGDYKPRKKYMFFWIELIRKSLITMSTVLKQETIMTEKEYCDSSDLQGAKIILDICNRMYNEELAHKIYTQANYAIQILNELVETDE